MCFCFSRRKEPKIEIVNTVCTNMLSVHAKFGYALATSVDCQSGST